MYVGGKLKKLRTELGLNQEKIATALGLSQSYYSAVERGKKKMTSSMLKKIEDKWPVFRGWFDDAKKGNKMGVENGGNVGGGDLNDLLSVHVKSGGRVILGNGTRTYESLLVGYYNSLTDKELDIYYSTDFEDLKEVFNAYLQLVEVLHTLKAPEFLKEKFRLSYPDFKAYFKDHENSFNEEHAHIKDERAYKTLKIIFFLRPNIEHWHAQISNLISYVHRYVAMFE